ncbi:hypothetical protein I3842_06G073600 [Carya illinoinensis]|uniref:RNase H type-1 domain-containing protein n=1 Tax=Carya illinoinensis TaxID=32201 RepID=A0A922EUT9_CARIL|nr:hypothetical protein I3842_06G073600 [Carya illinoinensis]
MVKANCDATFDAEARKVGVGVIIRNERGEVMVAYHEQKLNVADLVIINAVNVQVEDLSYVGSLVEEQRRSLKGCNGWRVQYSHRNTNVVAHKLAKAAILIEEEMVWIEEAPIFVLDSLVVDKQYIDHTII